jgi:hypothetical protein
MKRARVALSGAPVGVHSLVIDERPPLSEAYEQGRRSAADLIPSLHRSPRHFRIEGRCHWQRGTSSESTLR